LFHVFVGVVVDGGFFDIVFSFFDLIDNPCFVEIILLLNLEGVQTFCAVSVPAAFVFVGQHVLQLHLETVDDEFQADVILVTARHNDVCFLHLRLDERLLTGPHKLFVHVQDEFHVHSAQFGVAEDAAAQPDVTVGVHLYFDVLQVSQYFRLQSENALD